MKAQLSEFMLSLFRKALVPVLGQTLQAVDPITTIAGALDPERPYEFINIEQTTLNDMLIKPNNQKIRRWGIDAALAGTMKLYYPPEPNKSVTELKSLIEARLAEEWYVGGQYQTKHYTEVNPKRKWNNILKPVLVLIWNCLKAHRSNNNNATTLTAIAPLFDINHV